MKKYRYVLMVMGCCILIGTVFAVNVSMSDTNQEEQENETTTGEKEAVLDEVETKETEANETEDFGNGQYLKDIDWETLSTKVTEEEAKVIEKYRPVLEGEEFVWIYRTLEMDETGDYIHEQKQLTIQEMLDEEVRLCEMDLQEAVVDSFLFADVFQTGEENICLLFRHLGWYWLILHEDNGVIYGIDMPVRWFQGVQKDGLYYGSGGAGVSYYHRMSFINGDYETQDIGDVIYDELFIDDVKQSEEVYKKWQEENIKERVQWYLL